MDMVLAVATVAAADPLMAAFIERAGPFEPRAGAGDYFASLARSILFQQLAGRAAAAIHTRFVAAIGGEVTPDAVLAVSPEALRGAGLSANKAAAILDLATKATDGSVPLRELTMLDDDEIIARLSAVRGIGRWTAEMFLIFQLRRPDVWPVDDYGIRKGFAVIHDLAAPPTPKVLDTLGEIYRPYRSTAAWYCWRAVDTVLPAA